MAEKVASRKIENPHYVFIDTNIFLKIYSYSEDSKIPLSYLLELIEEGHIKLIVTQQVIDEYFRNRESKVAPSLAEIDRLKDQSFKIHAFCQDIENIKEIKAMFNVINDLAKKSHSELLKDVKEFSLEVDKLLDEIFKKSKIIPTTEEIIKEAKQRFDLGNPPGKNGSYGDSINWVTLLKIVPEKNDLYLITEDKDYISPIDNKEISLFLKREWTRLKKSKILLYRSISSFIKNEFEKEEITEKQIKEEEKPARTAYIPVQNIFPQASGAIIRDVGKTVNLFPIVKPHSGSDSVDQDLIYTCARCGNPYFISHNQDYHVCPKCGSMNFTPSGDTYL